MTDWVVNELKLGYEDEETLPFTIYPYYSNLNPK